jgi:hypothetical protein
MLAALLAIVAGLAGVSAPAEPVRAPKAPDIACAYPAHLRFDGCPPRRDGPITPGGSRAPFLALDAVPGSRGENPAPIDG